MKIQVRVSQSEDAAAIASIYAPSVIHGTASFETEPPDAEEMHRRVAGISALGLPYLVAEARGQLAGYAYASPFRPRPAYQRTVENSVYVAETFYRRGVARALMQSLINLCSTIGIREMVAVVGDPTVNQASVALHRSLGFDDVGTLRGIGVKFGRSLDVLMLQKSLTPR